MVNGVWRERERERIDDDASMDSYCTYHVHYTHIHDQPESSLSPSLSLAFSCPGHFTDTSRIEQGVIYWLSVHHTSPGLSRILSFYTTNNSTSPPPLHSYTQYTHIYGKRVHARRIVTNA